MGDETLDIGKTGIRLIFAAALIVILVGAFVLFRNVANRGTGQVEGGLDQLLQTSYDDYDQQIVSGNKVRNAIKIFSSESVGIIINTKLGGEDTAYMYGALLEKPAPSSATYLQGDNAATDTYGQVYPVSMAEANFKLRGDGVTVSGALPTGKISYNMNTRPLTASGKPTYVRDSARYQAMLIRDSTETVVGIYFEQLT